MIGEAGYTTPEQTEPEVPEPHHQRRPEQRRTRLESEDLEETGHREVIKKHLLFDAGSLVNTNIIICSKNAKYRIKINKET